MNKFHRDSPLPMDKKQQTEDVLWSAIVLSTVLVASLLIFPSFLMPKVLGQPNQTSNNTGVQPGLNVTSLGSQQSLIKSVIEKTANTNASDFAIKNLINATAGKDNITGGNNTVMKSVVNDTRNTNATHYGAHNVINATSPPNPRS
jgi:hypothetical protein